jgi:small subunit ribosomal protein S4
VRGGPKKKFRSKKSEYGIRLDEKQKLRIMTQMTEGPFANVFARASKSKGRTGEDFLRYLETRLDNIVRRVGFAVSLRAARQLVKHGHVRVNDKMVDIPSYRMEPGDKVSIEPATAELVGVKQGLEEAEKRSLRPSFLEYDAAKFSGKLVRWPDAGETSFPVNTQMIVEYYSK